MNKKFRKSVIAVAAILTVGTVAFVACEKDEIVTEQPSVIETRASTKYEITIDRDFRDSTGRIWHVKGTIKLEKWGKVSYNVDVTDPNGEVAHFEGTIFRTSYGTYRTEGVLIAEDGSILPMTDEMQHFFIEFTDYVLENY